MGLCDISGFSIFAFNSARDLKVFTGYYSHDITL